MPVDFIYPDSTVFLPLIEIFHYHFLHVIWFKQTKYLLELNVLNISNNFICSGSTTSYKSASTGEVITYCLE
jgi:hypothetical protein